MEIPRLFERASGWPIGPLVRKPKDGTLISVAKSPIRAVRWVSKFPTAAIAASVHRRRISAASMQMEIPLRRNMHASSDGLTNCAIRFINLDARQDRRVQFEAEMARLEVTWHARHPGVLERHGAIGCGQSHIDVLRQWDDAQSGLLLVCEDDAEFVANRVELDSLIDDFQSIPRAMVLALAHRTAWTIPYSKRFATSSDIQTTAAYVIKKEFRSQLIHCFDSAVRQLRRGGSERRHAIDIAWKELQRDFLFVLPRTTCVVQRESYSDVRREYVNYYLQ